MYGMAAFPRGKEERVENTDVDGGGGGGVDGFNVILGIELDSLQDKGTRWTPGMEKASSRIPKLTFGFRKSPSKTNGTVSEGNSPRNGTQTRPQTPPNCRSAPGSKNTSPNLSRSKSLRVPNSLQKRDQKSRSSTRLSEQNRDTEEGKDFYPENGKRDLRSAGRSEVTFLPRPRSKTIGPGSRSISNPNSRNVSPRRTLGPEEEEEVNTDDSLQHDDSSFQRRTKSFSAKRHNLSNTNSSARSVALARANSVRRSRTPNSLGTSTSTTTITGPGDSRTGNSTPTTNDTTGGSGGSGIVRTNSSGHTTRYSTQVPLHNSSRRDSTGASNRIKRPSSSFISEEDFTLEQYQNRNESSSHTPGGAKTGRGTLSAPGSVSKRSHSSIGYSYSDPRSPSPTSTITTFSSSGDPTPKSSRLLSSKQRSLSSNENLSRPSSATACYTRKSSRDATTTAGRPVTSTPTNGGGGVTPSQRRIVNGGSGEKEGTDGGVVSISAVRTATGLPPRTPYRVARTKAAPSSDLTGMNELEGSVLLEADDYRRLFNEVKALKTALLKLKRELQVDSESTSAPNNNANVRPGRFRTSPVPGQTDSAEYNKKLKAVGMEKEILSSEVAKLKKEGKMKNSRIESLAKELAKEQEAHMKVVEELSLVTGQRNRLLDKVERLHADKHTLEARLNTLERASIYEQTWSDNWMDELDGEEMEDNDDETSFGDSLDTDPLSFTSGGSGSKGGPRAGGKRGMDSDVVDSFHSDGGEGENSEPESTAVCSAPII